MDSQISPDARNDTTNFREILWTARFLPTLEMTQLYLTREQIELFNASFQQLHGQKSDFSEKIGFLWGCAQHGNKFFKYLVPKVERQEIRFFGKNRISLRVVYAHAQYKL